MGLAVKKMLESGYKMTEVGVVPEDWEVRMLSDVARFSNGKAHEQFIDEDGQYVVINSKFISTEGKVYKNSKIAFALLEADDLTMVMSDIPNGKALAKCFYVTENNKYTLNQRICSLKSYDCSSKFLYWVLNRNKYFLAFDSGTGQTNLKRQQVLDCLFPLPPTKAEQTAIANALSDADALINSLEKLIEKKRAIKQGAMQELLRPKEGWVESTLKEIAKFRRGSFPQPYGLDKWYDDTNGAPFVQVYDVDDNFKLKEETKRKISPAAQEMSVFMKEGSVILTIQGSIGRIAITQYDAYVDRTLLLFESFLIPMDKYFFLLSVFTLFEKEKQSAPGGIIKTITKEALSNFKMQYPVIHEQSRISKILLQMNEEIVGLETKLSKQKFLKQAMMQELLTGRTRLI